MKSQRTSKPHSKKPFRCRYRKTKTKFSKKTQKQFQDFYKRERRSRNVVLSNVKESGETKSSACTDLDRTAAAIFSVPVEDVLKVFRADPCRETC